ncbi:aminotransferase class I/II-fold pyridoxal phosphate-dependent enzyme [Phycisphaera mikurensis]|uniref:Aminotransferase n=1 Tax=Phycisphaera mikurensis (strain NBRC 102666 / KCTC 22515 / FYK2301M01) TaxID=1142394 RepID=I0ICR0_PHYMF|nr:aminotransferase class I/II-fold pyridoxal phosphate-dependent enzyme [Phycisphaera mikurensis]MBB6442078.1 aspartate/methionine/tyrosine aminotransferase [Phycisphaera mikurensis]BAM03048.1 putative aminotransferase [Phycisphaera mikurensis NBRC 102666]
MSSSAAPPAAAFPAFPPFLPFELERDLSAFEYEVAYNLSESGVHPLSVAELYEGDPGAFDRLRDVSLYYAPGAGLPALREAIASTYRTADASNVLVTVGAVEANFAGLTAVTRPGDEVVVMSPNYQQVYGAAVNYGLQVKTFPLDPARGFAPDLAALREAVTERTRLIAVCHPNNPTGRALTPEEMAAVITEAERVGAWILSDEVYRGSERRGGDFTPSFFDAYDKVIATGSTSKAYGLPGFRIGWAATDAGTVDQMWARREYLTLCTATIANHMAAYAMASPVRDRVVERTRTLIREGYAVLERWIGTQGGRLALTPHDAAAITLLRFDVPHLDSRQFVTRLRERHDVLLAPGDHLGVPDHVRLSFGLPEDYLQAGLDRIAAFLDEETR